MIEEPTYEPVDFYDDREELFLDIEAKRRQDDAEIDPRGLRRQQLDTPFVGVTPGHAFADHPEEFQAQTHVLGPTRRRKVGKVSIHGHRAPVHGLAQVDLVTGIQTNTGDRATLTSRDLPDEFHADDLPRLTLSEALATEDLAEVCPRGAINQIRKGPTTRRFIQLDN